MLFLFTYEVRSIKQHLFNFLTRTAKQDHFLNNFDTLHSILKGLQKYY